MKVLFAVLFVVFMFGTVGVVDAEAATMLVRQGKVSGNFYGGGAWGTMTTNLNNAFGGSSNITVLPNFDAANLSNYDAVWVDAANGTDTLSATEVTKLQAFAATGKRVFLIGENAGWTVWDNSILSIVGDAFSGGAASTTYTPVITHPLTNGITAIDLPAGGTAVGTGGTSLFTTKFSLLYGATQNVLVILDVNIFANSFIGNADNTVFAANVANFFVESANINISPSPTPQPAQVMTSPPYQHPSTTDTPTCGDSVPVGKPDLFEIDAASNFATLSFKTVEHGVTGYAFSYGYDQKAENFSDKVDYNGPKWLMDHTIWHLSPNTTYYFKVRALNGCGVGEWSNVMNVKTGGKLASISQYFPNALQTDSTPSVMGVSKEANDCNYTVQSGDSLWKIASMKWGNGSKYTEIMSFNSGINSNSVLKVGSQLKLCL